MGEGHEAGDRKNKLRVQICVADYEHDPSDLKVVARDQWFVVPVALAAPAMVNSSDALKLET